MSCWRLFQPGRGWNRRNKEQLCSPIAGQLEGDRQLERATSPLMPACCWWQTAPRFLSHREAHTCPSFQEVTRMWRAAQLWAVTATADRSRLTVRQALESHQALALSSQSARKLINRGLFYPLPLSQGLRYPKHDVRVSLETCALRPVHIILPTLHLQGPGACIQDKSKILPLQGTSNNWIQAGKVINIYTRVHFLNET